MPKKPTSSPVSVQTYINGEYLAGDVDDNHSTLPIRNSESADIASADVLSFVNTGQSRITAAVKPLTANKHTKRFFLAFLGRLFDRVDLIRPVSYVHLSVRSSTKSLFDFDDH